MEIEQIKVDKVFKVCPNCGYKHSFHPMFERIENSKELHCYNFIVIFSIAFLILFLAPALLSKQFGFYP